MILGKPNLAREAWPGLRHRKRPVRSHRSTRIEIDARYLQQQGGECHDRTSQAALASAFVDFGEAFLRRNVPCFPHVPIVAGDIEKQDCGSDAGTSDEVLQP